MIPFGKVKKSLLIKLKIKPKSTQTIPNIPTTPKPGITKISKAIRIKPIKNNKISQFAAKPSKYKGAKYKIAPKMAITVGKPMPGTEVKIDPDTNEIIVNTQQCMLGYYEEPDKTNEVIRNGYLYTGDKGIIDENGYLKVIGRVNDAFKTAKGKFITPHLIEEEIIKSNIIEQVCVAGLGIPQPIALVNLAVVTKEMSNKEIELALKRELERVNSELMTHEKISTIIVCKEAWSEENQLLTPTLKARRGKVDERYLGKYLEWHEASAEIIWE